MNLGRRGAPTGNDNAAKARENKPDGRKVCFGNNAAYLAARIRRDAPEIADRMHEFGSTAAAARAAGIPVPKPTRLTLGNPETVARRLIEHGEDYARAVAQSATWLKGSPRSNAARTLRPVFHASSAQKNVASDLISGMSAAALHTVQPQRRGW